MYSNCLTALLQGISTLPIRVEVDVSNGMPMFDMVGNLAPEVREARERVKTALHNTGILLPAKRITVNLSPANTRKYGAGFDLPIAVGLLCSMGLVAEEELADTIFVGELALNGRLLPVNGVLPIVADGMERGIKKFVLPLENRKEARLVLGASVFAFENIGQVLAYLQEGEYREPPEEESSAEEKLSEIKRQVDFAEIHGQKFLKRACQVAASGMHNMLMIGPPGAGKTMISERMATILPGLNPKEQLELSKIYSVCGLMTKEKVLLNKRPFRSPHHTITNIGMVGGGAVPKPGEISLAHCGVLFLDELTEFRKETLEVLRQPLEDRCIHLTRLNSSLTYPADFLLLAAMNPCNCGYYPDRQKCRCSQATLQRYFDKLSQPLLDRIDLCVEAPSVSFGELSGGRKKEETSLEMRKRVEACQALQFARFEGEDFFHNAQIPAAKLEEYCPLSKKEMQYMEEIFQKENLTARTYHKILRVARTIADMEESKNIEIRHLQEAVCYRIRDRRFWGGETE